MHFKKRHTESHMTIPWTFNAYCPMFILAVHHTWVKDVHFELLIGLEVKVHLRL